MLTMLKVTTNQGAILSLPLQDISAGYLIKDIEGLDPVQANLVSSGFAGLDGEQFQSTRREKRNIVLKLGIEPDYVATTVRDLRNRLYGFFMPKSEVTLQFEVEGMPPVCIMGRVETFVSPMFTESPEATISLLCMSPDFYDPNPITVNASSSPSSVDAIINYEGTVDTGFDFQLNVNRSIAGFTIISEATGAPTRKFDFTAPLIAGDVLNVRTIAGDKSVTLTRANQTNFILYGMTPYSDWLQLQMGENKLSVNVAGAAIPFSVTYNSKHGGL